MAMRPARAKKVEFSSDEAIASRCAFSVSEPSSYVVGAETFYLRVIGKICKLAIGNFCVLGESVLRRFLLSPLRESRDK
jgi:hypothetical protein